MLRTSDTTPILAHQKLDLPTIQYGQIWSNICAWCQASLPSCPSSWWLKKSNRNRLLKSNEVSAIGIFLSAFFTPPLHFSYDFWANFCLLTSDVPLWIHMSSGIVVVKAGSISAGSNTRKITSMGSPWICSQPTPTRRNPFPYRSKVSQCLTCKDANSTSTSIKTNNAHLAGARLYFGEVALPFP